LETNVNPSEKAMHDIGNEHTEEILETKLLVVELSVLHGVFGKRKEQYHFMNRAFLRASCKSESEEESEQLTPVPWL